MVDSTCIFYFFFQAEDGIRDLVRSRGLGDVYKRQDKYSHTPNDINHIVAALRKKIEKDYKNPSILTNIRGLGYRFITNQ